MVHPPDSAPTQDDPLAAALAAWRAQIELDLKGAPFEKRLVTRTPEGVAVQPLYTRRDLPAGFNATEVPGTGTRRRGRAGATGCRRLQAVCAADAEAFNRSLLAALMAGQDAVVLPAPGRCAGGWAPRTLDALAVALEGVDLTVVPVHVPCEDDALGAAALWLAHARESGVAWSRLTGSVAPDPIAAAVRRASAPTVWSGVMDDVFGWTTWCSENAPGLRTLAIDATVWGDAGAHGAQELGFALAAAAEYLREGRDRGIAPEVLTRHLLVRFAVGPRFFLELAKFRAWRTLLTKLMVALQEPAAAADAVEVHAVTGTWNKTRLDVHVNLLRTTTEALSAVLGGVDGLEIAPFDAVTGEHSPMAERVARNLHLVLADEFGFGVPADAAGGSWYVERATDELARQAWTVFREVEARGGLRAALAEGWPQAQVLATAAQRDREFASRRSGLIGSNLFPNLRDALAAPTEPTPAAPATAPNLGGRTWPACLQAATVAARDGVSIEALDAGSTAATVTWSPLPTYRAAAPFEILRAAALRLAKERGRAPAVHLVRLGPVKQHKPRADFAAGFFGVGGFIIEGKGASATADDGATAAVASSADVVVICSTDETYPDVVPVIARAVKAAHPTRAVVVAGAPRDAALEGTFREAGVDEFIHVKSDLPEQLGRLLKRLGAQL